MIGLQKTDLVSTQADDWLAQTDLVSMLADDWLAQNRPGLAADDAPPDLRGARISGARPLRGGYRKLIPHTVFFTRQDAHSLGLVSMHAAQYRELQAIYSI